MVIQRGDVFWAQLGPATGSEPAHRRPVIIIQRDAINRSQFNTVVVIPLTSQTRHSHLPGNVLLGKSEANIPKASLARATHLMVVDKERLIEKIGTLSQERLEAIVDAVCWVIGR
ncbi:MAG: type II toxin-antitoxin system PemK/MazF family toxin [Candidatus Handelsmanbacteria bacterium]|nr:type II toxin-antitoxin system PemK/MazF family toxin [Candidatus Handelsmanbacteria bacterium]